MPPPDLIFATQVSWMMVSCALVARWYVAPALARLPLEQALQPLLAVHLTRVIGLSFLVEALTDPRVPWEISYGGAVGDMAAAALALLGLLALRAGSPVALALVWAANVVGLGDLLHVSIRGILVNYAAFRLGPVWFIPTFLGPVMIVSHVLMFWLLLRRPSPGPVRR